MICPYCAYEWFSRKDDPKKCPNQYCQRPLATGTNLEPSLGETAIIRKMNRVIKNVITKNGIKDRYMVSNFEDAVIIEAGITSEKGISRFLQLMTRLGYIKGDGAFLALSDESKERFGIPYEKKINRELDAIDRLNAVYGVYDANAKGNDISEN